VLTRAERQLDVGSIGGQMMGRRRTRVVAQVSLLLCLAGTSSAVWAARCDLKSGMTAQQGRLGLCKFNAQKGSFAGTPAEQAVCLTREVKRLGIIGGETIPPFLKNLAGKPAPAAASVQRLLDGKNIKPGQIGGPTSKPITANYFIIHDTSSPNCSEQGVSTARCPQRGEFPPNRDDASWPVNRDFDGHPKAAPHRLAHVFNNRAGDSVTEVDYADHIATTKFERCADSDAKDRLFVGIENIQPRVGDPRIPAPGRRVNDFDAPQPGFSQKQYERLALLYLVASARRGQWLIPAFHAVIDSQYADGHDDPQKFDITSFSDEVKKHLDAVNAP
jgi:hypothetical protein